MMKLALGALAFAAASLLLPLAHAEPISPSGTSAVQIQSWLATRGMVATLKADKDGEPYLTVRSNNLNWEVDFYGCDKGTPIRCPSIQFTSWWNGTFTQETANSWNRDFRYVKAYVDDDGKAITGQMDIMLLTGMTTEQLNQDLDIWLERMVKLDNHVAVKK